MNRLLVVSVLWVCCCFLAGAKVCLVYPECPVAGLEAVKADGEGKDKAAGYARALELVRGGYEGRDRVEGMRLLEGLADEGDGRSEYLLATVYLDDEYVTRDVKKAFALLNKYGGDARNESLVPKLALCHVKGWGTQKDVAKGLGMLKGVMQGNDEAMLYYCALQAEGRDVPLDREAARKRLEVLEGKGVFEAVGLLAGVYNAEGEHERALDLLKKWAEKGGDEAVFLLAMEHTRSPLLVKDESNFERAMGMFYDLIDKGNPAAMKEMGTLMQIRADAHEDGVLLMRARNMYRQAAECHHAGGAVCLASLMLLTDAATGEERGKAREVLRDLADRGIGAARGDWGMLLYVEAQSEAEYKRAFHYLNLAHEEHGIQTVLDVLVHCYEFGQGTKKDLKKAAELREEIRNSRQYFHQEGYSQPRRRLGGRD